MSSRLDWVIAGGESGHGARPMHPKWARGLRDQCQAAGVAFLYKQTGEWAPAPWKLQRDPDEFTLDYKARSEALGATHAFTGGLRGDGSEHFMRLDHAPWSCERDDIAPPGAQGMRRAGKKAAGRLLDGREWNEYPEVADA
jgi:protein gp37